MKARKHILMVVTAVAIFSGAYGQEITQELKPFTKIIASPHINLVLEKGDHESIRLVHDDISASKINIEVKGQTLKIYLDDARITDKLERVGRHTKRSVYENVSITAYVTYKELKQLEVRGEQEVSCHDQLTAKKFKLKAYGETEIDFAGLRVENFKTSLYGQNNLRIRGGRADYSKYKLYGENKVDTRELITYSASTTIFGESRLKITSEDELKVNSFGDGEVRYAGNANVNRGLIFGETKIKKMN